MTKTLYIVRGLPGSGKSTLGFKIADMYSFAADDFFDENYGGKFIPSKLSQAHQWCYQKVRNAMVAEASDIAVCNTFTQFWESKPYIELAKEFGYVVHSIIVEKTHNNPSIHNVPSETIEKMRKRFEVNL